MKTNPIITQEQADAAVAALLKGQRAEIFASIDPDTGRIQVLYECQSQATACILLSQIVESLAKKGLGFSHIRQAVELGLDHRKRWQR